MDFLDPKKKQAHRNRLFIGYALVAIMIFVVAYILMLITSSYGYDRESGKIVQNGLVFVDAHPTSAKIFINNKEKGDTAGRYVLQEGTYSLELRRDGYRSWNRTFNLEGAAVERFIYPFLFPQQLESKEIGAYDVRPDMVTQSPDRRWIVTHLAANANRFIVTDTSGDDSKVTTITVPEPVLPSRPNPKLEALEWSTNNRHILVKNTYDGGVDYALIDRQEPQASTNLNSLFPRPVAHVALRDKNIEQLYVLDVNGLLELIDVRTRAIEAIAQRVSLFFPYRDNTLLYVTETGAAQGKVLVKLREGNDTYTLRTLPKGTEYFLNTARFDGDQYVVIGTNAESKVYIYTNPLEVLKRRDATPAVPRLSLRTDAAIERLSFSANARFIALQGGNTLAVYDAEDDRQFRYNTGLELAAGEHARWMDGHRLTLVSQDKLYVFDFDGSNKHELLPAYSSSTTLFDRDYTALFTFAPNKAANEKASLTRTELVVDR